MPTNESHDELDSVLNQLERSPEPEASRLPLDATDYQSPTLATIDAKLRPNPSPICAACPQSLWFASAEQLQCYCRLMHVITWTSEAPRPILQCDGPILSTP